MKNAIYLTTNAYDMILLPDGTFIQVDEEEFNDFGEAMYAIDPYNWNNWTGNDRWDKFAESMDEAADILVTATSQAASGDQTKILAYYTSDNVFVIVDEEELRKRCEFYGFNILSHLGEN